jgi:glycosyltransferase involved in cell wall biosynthesis
VTLNVLVIDRSPPLSSSQGTELIGRELFPRLRRSHRLTLVAPVLVGQEDAGRALLADTFDAVHLLPRRRKVSSLQGALEPGLGRLRVPARGGLDPGAATRLGAAIRSILAAERFDLVHVRLLPMASYAPDLGPLPRLLELVDSETLGAARVTSGSRRADLRRRMARLIERRAIRSFPVITVVAEADAAAIRRLAPGRRVEVIPNGVDADRFRPIPGVAAAADTVAFVGAMSFPPNVAAVEWFAERVLPLIRAARPGVRFVVAGRDPAPAVLALARDPAIKVTGAVDDVRPYLAEATVVLAPMVSGSGIKNKVLEALAMARPVVTTPLGVEGVAAEPGVHLLVADGPDAFAGAVLGLLADPDQAAMMGGQGRLLVERLYTWDACADSYANLYAELAGSARSTR